MNRVLYPGPRCGSVTVPASKSHAQRLILAAALSSSPHTVICHGISRDIRAMCDCLNACCAGIRTEENRIIVTPYTPDTRTVSVLPCGESGAVLRFLLPVAGALGIPAVFRMEGRLIDRPLSPLLDALSAHGMSFRYGGKSLHCSGHLTPGDFRIPGNISSQFVSGLLFALPLLNGESRLTVSGEPVSAGYVRMTEDVLRLAQVPFSHGSGVWEIRGHAAYEPPSVLYTEADWSGAAVFLCMGALSPAGVTVSGPELSSHQPDRAVLDILRRFGADVTVSGQDITVRGNDLSACDVDVSACPDLMPVLCAVAAGAKGVSRITGAGRLRGKETDRLLTVKLALDPLGADLRETEDGILITGHSSLNGGAVPSSGDHRIAMSAAVAASLCDSPVIVENTDCTDKSFPLFWETLNSLEAYI